MQAKISALYLKKLGFEGDFSPTLANLKSLLSRHVQAIPFGNLSSFLGDEVSLASDQLVQKLLIENREGYCLEHSTLTRIALTELGYEAYNVLGRVYYQSSPSSTPVRTHLVTLVCIDQQLFLYDPGFGGMTPTTVLSLDQIGETQQTPLEPFRFVEAAQSGLDTTVLTEMTYMLQVYIHGQWVNVYAINSEQQIADADALVANWYISTSPESLFTQYLMLSTANAEVRITLKDRVLRTHGKGNSDKKELFTLDEFEQSIKSVFRIDISQEMLEATWAKLTLNL
ncbi:arylamine N-acetyltransferase [Acinetobacter sp. C26M]|uniref:arylamine N-acetyltransferase family protein n=1 Tax=unclassified Acinetobacter TaxID=196816 RepID=UPI0020370F7F|nr:MULTISPECIES: arylamine N-acetyltransferase [unclassified Acinetobacter]USA47143.1 arylamine N-acetyltransferase [Acinetobacter sp. C26M]USA50624.1 arylamine N-acetyltransferase [Acinetobacter sp. C26G]